MNILDAWRRIGDTVSAWQERREIRRINKWAKKNGIKQSDIRSFLENHRGNHIDFLDGEKVRFFWLRSVSHDIKKRNMTAFFAGVIGVNDNWMKQLICANDNDRAVAEDAYRLMLAHEHSHHVWYKNDWLDGFKKRSPIDYVNEVFADVNGFRLAFPDDLERAVAAAEWLMKTADENSLHHTQTHPAWEQRIEYIKLGRFDADTIRDVVQLAGGKPELANRLMERYRSKQNFIPHPAAGSSADDIEMQECAPVHRGSDLNQNVRATEKSMFANDEPAPCRQDPVFGTNHIASPAHTSDAAGKRGSRRRRS